MVKNMIDQLMATAQWKGLLRARDLAEKNIPREYLRRASDQGLLERIGRGLYRVSGTMATDNQSLAEVCRKVPTGAVCLLSALRFHDLTTQNPFEVWLAVAPKARSPRMDTVTLRVVRFSGDSLTQGVERHRVAGVEICVYSAAKTVADCFKFRNKIGIDVAVEALRDCLRQRKAKVDDLVRYARICRVERVMSPYMEAML
ncbi:MAG: type IV toxin-antitoxin system AbiEi family antitoxin domain-containing protein [Phycisphaerales bacterium]|nr:type IV toxin-antitoxin system AbiEi family antitoxin domain-containing protein [Phycisphaerales bacterium]